MQKSVIAIVAVLAATVTLAACDNTIRGAGKDIRQTGDAVQDATR